MNCNFCGSNVQEGTNFCPSCGNNLSQSTQYMNNNSNTNNQQLSTQNQVQHQAVDFTIQQQILAIRRTYKIKDVNDHEFMEARRPFFNFLQPHFNVTTPDGRPIGDIQGNFFRTTWKIKDAEGNVHAVIHFPLFSFIMKHFTIDTPNGTFQSGDSWFGYKFECFDSAGNMSFVVDKKVLSLHDTYKLQSSGELSPFVTTLSAIAIDERYHKGSSGILGGVGEIGNIIN